MPEQLVVQRVDWRDAQVKAAVLGATKAAALEGAQAILDEANKMVPFEFGTLKDSGRVDPTSKTGTTSAAISYSTPYAIRLHENPQYHFRNGRQGKWLEKALDTAQRALMVTMVRAYSRVFGRGMSW